MELKRGTFNYISSDSSDYISINYMNKQKKNGENSLEF